MFFKKKKPEQSRNDSKNDYPLRYEKAVVEAMEFPLWRWLRNDLCRNKPIRYLGTDLWVKSIREQNNDYGERLTISYSVDFSYLNENGEILSFEPTPHQLRAIYEINNPDGVKYDDPL